MEPFFERQPWQEANPSGKATWQSISQHKYIDFYPWREATPVRGHFLMQKGWPHEMGSTEMLSIDVELYTHVAILMSCVWHILTLNSFTILHAEIE